MIDYRPNQFREFIKEYGLFGKSLIEVGCGAGKYLQILNELNPRCYGIEYDEASLAVARGKDLDVFPMHCETGTEKVPEGPFDWFWLLNFLEHISAPNAMFSGIRISLVEQAIGIVKVPILYMIMRESLFSEFVIDHLFYLLKETLVANLMMNGFEVLKCEEP